MQRTSLTCAILPLAMILVGCSGDDNSAGNNNEDETGIPIGDGDGDSPDEGNEEFPGDGDGDDDGPSCGSVSISPEYIPPNVMLVVDASGSMVTNSWDHDLDPDTPDETRWATLYGVVDTVMGQFGASMNTGLTRFPSADACPTPQCYNADACIVSQTPEVGVALDNGAAILAAIPGPDGESIIGGTPATKGINTAVSHLVNQSAGIPRYILFITDGAANCTPGASMPELLESYDETLEPTVETALNDHGITTFVVGIDIVNAVVGGGPDGSPEANPFERLNDVALAGGAPKNDGLEAEKFFNSTNQEELLTALGEIIEEITECIIDLTQTEQGPPNEEQIPYVEFTANGEPVPYVEDCENEDGWTWLEEGLVVIFCGTYCDEFKGGGAVFDGEYGCPIG